MTRVWVAETEDKDVVGVLAFEGDMIAFAAQWWERSSMREPGEQLWSIDRRRLEDGWEVDVRVRLPSSPVPIVYASLYFEAYEVRS